MATVTVASEILDKLFYDEVHRYELVDGELRPKPMVSIYHSAMMAWVSHLLVNEAHRLRPENLLVLTDPLAKIPVDHWRRPDIAVLRAKDAAGWKYVMPGHWPILCIELASPPQQTVNELLEKCKLYHEQGVAYCWVIDPEGRTAWAYNRGETAVWISAEVNELSAGDIRIRLDELWKCLEGIPASGSE